MMPSGRLQRAQPHALRGRDAHMDDDFTLFVEDVQNFARPPAIVGDFSQYLPKVSNRRRLHFVFQANFAVLANKSPAELEHGEPSGKLKSRTADAF